MTVYDLESIDPDAANNSHAFVIGLVGRDRRVLDVGCSTGYLGEALKTRGCVVDGVEKDPEAAEAARARMHDVTVLRVSSKSVDGYVAWGLWCDTPWWV